MIGWKVVAAVAKRAVISSGVIVVSRCYVECVAMDEEDLVAAPICVVAVSMMGGDFAVIAW